MDASGPCREYFVKWDVLCETHINQFNDNGTLRVEGHFRQDKTRTAFCYKYNHWKGTRPDGVPEFTPCDFDPGRIVLLNARVPVSGLQATGTLGVVKVETDNPDQGSSKAAGVAEGSAGRNAGQPSA